MSEITENPIVTSPKELGDAALDAPKVDHKVDLSKGPVKKKESNITKVDLTKKPEKDAVHGKSVESVQDAGNTSEKTREDSKVEMPQPVKRVEDARVEEPIIQEITEEEKEEAKEIKKEVAEAIRDEKITGIKLPENVEKLVSFMEETGGTVEDYVRLNADYSKVDNAVLLKEYYKKAKPHLDTEEVNFMIEDNFLYDEEVDEERDIRKKKLAFKEEIAKAKTYLDDLKGKYYDEIKLRPSVTQEQKKATDFFNRYQETQKTNAKNHKDFKTATKELFNEDFKGFDFKLGEKKFRYGVKNLNETAEAQSDISNFVQKFLNKDGSIKDNAGYHKAMYAARNADTIASHFYEQGKADAIKNVVKESKNIKTDARQTPSEDVFVGGFKVRAVSGADSTKLKVKTRKFN
tara:strand:+ start:3538 stop:4752 length:1215 start_codon:yes stop_codon:yes gene_type:complete